jgi:hypothetical protein
MQQLPAVRAWTASQVADLGPGQRLSQLCDLVVQRFRQAGLMLPVRVVLAQHRRLPVVCVCCVSLDSEREVLALPPRAG